MDLETLKKYNSGKLSQKEFLTEHEDCEALMDLLNEHLGVNEEVASVQDWPEPKKKAPHKQYIVLKILLLLTPLFFITGGVASLLLKDELAAIYTLLILFAVFVGVAFWMLYKRKKEIKTNEGKTVLVVTNRRLMRIWLDGTEMVQAWWLGEDNPENFPLEAVSPTIKLLLDIDLGKNSLN